MVNIQQQASSKPGGQGKCWVSDKKQVDIAIVQLMHFPGMFKLHKIITRKLHFNVSICMHIFLVSENIRRHYFESLYPLSIILKINVFVQSSQ